MHYMNPNRKMENLKVLELFSGIGGMHYAFNYSGLPGKIIAALDINPVANNVYQHNHPGVTLMNNNIQKLTAKYIKKLEANTILMSPPCQPFTRVGSQRDIADNRSDGLKHICSILTDLDTIDFILMENVKGFEKSKARDLFIQSLKEAGFFYRELILSPSQLGIPNTRYRYFCLARKRKDFEFEQKPIWEIFPNSTTPTITPQVINKYLDITEPIPPFTIISDDILIKRVLLLDIVTPSSTNSICFTKAYTHYSEGTGSVLCARPINEVERIFNKIRTHDRTTDEYLNLLKQLQLRYFTPNEVARLMCFPKEFKFPTSTTNRQKYRLLGNSINVSVVGELIKVLCI